MSSGSLVVQRLQLALRHRERVVARSRRCFSSSFHSNIGKSTIQQNSNWSSAIRSSSVADLGAREAGELVEDRRVAGDEEGGVACLQAQLLADRLGRAPGRGSWRSGRRRPPRLRARRCSPGPAGLRPGPSCSSGRRRRGCRRSAPGWPRPRSSASRPGCAANRPKPPPRKCSETSCISIGLRRSGLSVPYLAMRLAVGDARERIRASPACRRRTPRTRRASRARWRRTRPPA